MGRRSRKKNSKFIIQNHLLLWQQQATFPRWKRSNSKAYNLETVLAEKLETVISRNVTNTRMRDFYDIYILQKLHGKQLKKQVLWNALVATARKRGTLEQINSGDRREIFDEREISSVMENLWKTYQKNYSYAADIS